MTATSVLLRAHQLQPVCLPGGVTVWRCPTCKVDYSATEARHGAAEAEHQAAALGCVDGWPEVAPEDAT